MKKLVSFSLLFFMFFIFTGCLQKHSDGKYHTQYSYHPYFNMYNKKIALIKKRDTNNYFVRKPSYIVTKKKSQIFYTKPKKKVLKKVFHSKVAYNDEDRYPSNVPIKKY